MNIVVKLISGVALVIIAAVGFAYSGVFNVATEWKDPAMMRWLLVETREASIEARAKDIQAPTLGGAAQIANGFRSYQEMCAVCHTPPGGTDSPITQGLNPTPPDLTEEDEHAMSNAELFWVIKNGIRMTGMPAWGPSHDDAEIWDIVAFLKALPTIDAAEYKRLDAQTPKGHGDAGAHGQAEAKKTSVSHSEESDQHNKAPMGAHKQRDRVGGHELPAASIQQDGHAKAAPAPAPIEYIDNGNHGH